MRSTTPAVLLTCLATAATAAQRAEAGPFDHDDPRFQVSATPSYVSLVGYDARTRHGGGMDACVLYQLTTAFSLALEAGWFAAEPLEHGRDPTQALRFKLMVRYDLDVLRFRPYLAAGATAAVFLSGAMRDAEAEATAGGVAAGANWGPVIEAGFDWRPVRWLVVGIVLDMAWLLRFAPSEANEWPAIRTAGIRAGVYF